MNKWEDYYALLGIDRYADDTTIRNAYKEKATIFHPDQPTGNEFMMKLLNTAYEVLSNPSSKASYDREWDARKASKETKIAKREDTHLATSTSFIDHYKALNLDRHTATLPSIRNAYLAVLKGYQEGQFGYNTELGMQIITFAEEAYSVLKDPDSKARYDELWDKNHSTTQKGTSKPVTQSSKKEVQEVRKTSPVVETVKQRQDLRNREEEQVVDKQETRVEVTPEKVDIEPPVIKENLFYGMDISGRKGLLPVIKMVLLEPDRINIKKSFTTSLVNIEDCYGIFYDDYTFQFVKEKVATWDYWERVYLTSIYDHDNSPLSELYREDKTVWNKFGAKFTMNGQQAIMFPIRRIVPSNLLAGKKAYKRDLHFIEEVIQRLLIMYPELLDAYFDDMTPNMDGKKM